MKRTILIGISFLFLLNVQAKKVDVQTAQNVGIAYYYEHVNQFIPCDFKAMAITSTYTELDGSLALYYVINFNKNGFIIVSADDKITPVIGYSYESSFDINNIPENLHYWLSGVKSVILDAIQNNISANAEISNSWIYYKSRTEQNVSIKKDKVIAPLLTSIWNQDKYYNQYCPTATGGPDNKAYVGCVATSMVQIMYYYRYPATGLGTHGAVNYGTTTYNWDSMVDDVANYNNAVATLSYQAGIAVNMSYSATGSGAQTSDCPAALTSHFRYNSTVAYADYGHGSYSTQTAWQTLLKSNLDLNHPLIYSGFDPTNGGHAWNCDGYDASNNFHMNWGWSGYYNGFFATTNLTAGSNNFSSGQGVVYNFFPPTTSYPSNCTGTKTLTSSIGSFEDGSGPSNYQNNSDCMWLIDPTETVTKITLSFKAFSTEATNDVVTVYDGNSTSSPVLGTYSGSTLPASISSTGDQLLVRFQTNASVVNSGWKIEYRSTYPKYCSGITTLTAPSGTINDGSFTDNYSYSQLCRWSINPTNATSITLSFSAMDLAANDSLRVTDLITGLKVAAYSGTTIPTSQTYNTSKLLLLFTTDSYLNSQGFDASYTSTSSGAGIDENSSLNSLTIFPNPAKEQVTIQFTQNNTESLSIELNSLSGVSVFTESLNSFSGNYSKTIETGSLAQGIYLLRIVGEKQTICKKIVIE
ncbi:MAG: C10 family peptidase [Bacteroidota bacterium]